MLRRRSNNNNNRPDSLLLYAAKNNDIVLVIGGTSGIGQLVTEKLAATTNDGTTTTVRVTTRSTEKGQELFGTKPNVDVVALDLLSTNTQPLQQAMEGASAVVISVGTTAFPTLQWKGGNTPQAIDQDAVTRIATVVANTASVQKVVLVTSVGVQRTNEMPFRILNLFGVLDAKRAGEQAIMEQSQRDYVIVRPGRLVGGPFTNLDVAKLLQIEGGAENGVDVAKGDALLGDCKRDACAECIVQALACDTAKNVDFSIVSNDGLPAKTEEEWKQTFASL